MALIILGGGVAAASGSMGGTVFSRNRSGAYIRNRSIPLNPNSSQQQTIRNALTSLVTAWIESLTTPQRMAWDTYAANVPVTNRLGQQAFLTGQNWYIAANTPRIQAGLARVDAAPTVFNRGTFTPISATGDGSSQLITVTFTNTDAWASEGGSSLLVYGARSQNFSAEFRKSSFRFAGKVDGNATTPPTSPVTIASPFTFVSGTRSFVRVSVTRADGRISTPQETTIIVV